MAGTANILRRCHQDSLQPLGRSGSAKNIDRSSAVSGVSTFDSGRFVAIGAGSEVKKPLRAERIERGADSRRIKNVDLVVKTAKTSVERFALVKI
jgi:hypothetical protein